MNTRPMRFLGGALLIAAPATAQITPIPPFNGAIFDDFSNSAQQVNVQCYASNLGDLCSPVGTMAMFGTPNLITFWCQGPNIVWPYTGVRCMLKWGTGTAQGADRATLTFGNAPARFGGYFADAGDPNVALLTTFDFYDAAQNLVGSAQVSIPKDCDWHWFGWQIGPTVASVDIIHDGGNVDPGALVMDYLVMDGQGPLGANYCGPANVNSTGLSATISASGSAVAADNNLTLVAENMPQNQFGYFLASQSQAFVQNPGGSQGNLCLGGNIGRFVQQIQNSGSAGGFGINVDLTGIPTTPVHSVVAGETWNFQSWFRDMNPQQTSNFTDGLEILFQ